MEKLKIVFILSVLYLVGGSLSFAQEVPQSVWSPTTSQGEQKPETSPPPVPEHSATTNPTVDDIQRLIEERKAQGEDFDEDNLNAMLNKFIHLSQQQQGQGAQISEEEQERMALENIANSPIGKYFGEDSELLKKYVRFILRVSRDEEAIKSLVGILGDKGKLKYYAAAVAAVFIFGFFLNTLEYSNRTWFQRVKRKFMLSALIISCQVGVFYYFFSEGLAPVIAIFKQTFLA